MKKIWWIILFSLIVAFGMFVSDIYRSNRAISLLDQVRVNLSYSDTVDNKNEFTKLTVKIDGELPNDTNKLAIFADNRFLELSMNKLETGPGITYSGLGAFGTEAVFLIDSNNNSNDLNVYYQKKNNPDFPLIYAFIETDLNRIFFSDTSPQSKIVTLQQKKE